MSKPRKHLSVCHRDFVLKSTAVVNVIESYNPTPDQGVITGCRYYGCRVWPGSDLERESFAKDLFTAWPMVVFVFAYDYCRACSPEKFADNQTDFMHAGNHAFLFKMLHAVSVSIDEPTDPIDREILELGNLEKKDGKITGGVEIVDVKDEFISGPYPGAILLDIKIIERWIMAKYPGKTKKSRWLETRIYRWEKARRDFNEKHATMMDAWSRVLPPWP